MPAPGPGTDTHQVGGDLGTEETSAVRHVDHLPPDGMHWSRAHVAADRYKLRELRDLSAEDDAALTRHDAARRTPLDLLSRSRRAVQLDEKCSGSLFSWGSTANYQLGQVSNLCGRSDRGVLFCSDLNRTGCRYATNGRAQTMPRLVELPGEAMIVCTSKYHTLVVNSDGRAFSCGFGTGRRISVL